MLDSLWNMCKAVEVAVSELPTQETNIGCVGLSLAMWVETYRDHEPAAARSLLLRDLHSLTAAGVDVVVVVGCDDAVDDGMSEVECKFLSVVRLEAASADAARSGCVRIVCCGRHSVVPSLVSLCNCGGMTRFLGLYYLTIAGRCV